jgi:molybdenum cofactor cytidylyltransferase
MAEPPACALVLLAAGASRRMGRPKQLLPVAGLPLLRRVAERALAAPVSPVIVVLGAHAAEIAPCLNGLRLRIVINDCWQDGMGSSVRVGMQALLTAGTPAADAVIVALADQPDCSADHFRRLIEARRTTGRTIVASEYEGVRGPPVLFAARYFPELLALQGDTGARPLLQSYAHEVAAVPLSTARDLDTPADYDFFLRHPDRPAR